MTDNLKSLIQQEAEKRFFVPDGIPNSWVLEKQMERKREEFAEAAEWALTHMEGLLNWMASIPPTDYMWEDSGMDAKKVVDKYFSSLKTKDNG